MRAEYLVIAHSVNEQDRIHNMFSFSVAQVVEKYLKHLADKDDLDASNDVSQQTVLCYMYVMLGVDLSSIPTYQLKLLLAAGNLLESTNFKYKVNDSDMQCTCHFMETLEQARARVYRTVTNRI